MSTPSSLNSTSNAHLLQCPFPQWEQVEKHIEDTLPNVAYPCESS